MSKELKNTGSFKLNLDSELDETFIGSIPAVKEAPEFVESLEPSTTMFDLVFSNPPYQIDTGGKRHQVYPEFYRIANIVGKASSMIFPIGWQRSTGRASGSSYHSTMREDKTIVFVDNYYEDKNINDIILFDAGTGGVNLIMNNKGFDNKGSIKFYEYGEFIDDRDLSKVEYWSERTQEVFDKVLEWMNDNSVEGMPNGFLAGIRLAFQEVYLILLIIVTLL